LNDWNTKPTLPPQIRQPRVVEQPELLLADERTTRTRRIESRHAVHQRRLPRPRRTHHRREAAAFELDADAVKRTHRSVARAVDLRQPKRAGSRRR
jgi:hypothetical protein